MSGSAGFRLLARLTAAHGKPRARIVAALEELQREAEAAVSGGTTTTDGKRESVAGSSAGAAAASAGGGFAAATSAAADAKSTAAGLETKQHADAHSSGALAATPALAASLPAVEVDPLLAPSLARLLASRGVVKLLSEYAR